MPGTFSQICNVKYNYAYFPVLLYTEEAIVSVIAALANEEIYPRRYFFPSLNKLPYFKGVYCPVAEDISSKVLCLPLYNDLSFEDVRKIRHNPALIKSKAKKLDSWRCYLYIQLP